jgi:hypothetical protein
MSEGPFDRQRAALGELWRMIEERRQGEEELTVSSARDEEAAVEEGEKARRALADAQERELAELDATFHTEQEDLTERQQAEETAARQSLAANRLHLETTEREERERIGGELRDALWMADSVLEGGEKRVQQHLEAVQRKVAAGEKRIASLWEEVTPLLARADLVRDDVEPGGKPSPPPAGKPPDPEAPLTQADALLRQMRQLPALRWMSQAATVGIAVGACAVASVPALFLRPALLWLACGVAVGLLVTLGSQTVLHSLARRRLLALGRSLAVLLARARDLGAELEGQTEAWAAFQRTELRNKRVSERRKAESVHRPQLDELNRRTRTEREALEKQFQARSEARRLDAEQALEASRRRYEESRSRCLSRQEQERRDAEAAHADRLRGLAQTRTRKAEQLRQRWEAGAGRVLATFTELQRLGDAVRGDAKPQAADTGPLTPGLPFGTLTIDVQQLAGETPAEKLAPLPSGPLELPAFLPFPRLGGLLLHAFVQGRAAAVQALQALMLRFLTALPPGKVRFTILDPVGLGDNFAAFMHLADHDEALVGSRIWTEPAHIEKQLGDLTVHMENVIQKYLRRQFRSIEDYNAQAGEVAEPYRVLVVANFPVNFTPQAARRLVSIVQSGSSCGVYALVSLDTRQPLPQGFQVEDLEQLCLNLYWRQDRFRWGDADLDRFPLALEAPPEPDRVIEAVRRVGALSRDANRVQVPFSYIAPAEDEVWRADSRRGIVVPLGRAGAVRRLSLELGRGTSQHVLVAGKTGSGKSTLWHALISNLALLYSPDEVELYLIDFKKGVEFKPYAVRRLPHARVIAIESEREFGLSVLQRLDAELRRRGDLFRSAGVNDIAGYREAHPGCFPRILLIVDEFQEFFVEDDRLSQEAALLLDRLVRQGRAFGLHVLLGSQTLGGAYSLARSTIDQMAVRIALQCSEADAQLILNKDNSAARLLARPGEAIYNDTNGTLEGNEVFQVVWLPEEQREQVLDSLRRRAERERPDAAGRPPLVFEGNTPAELDRNPLLQGRVGETHPAQSAIGTAWLGEAIAIKDPTAAVFRPQTGNNLLVVGQNDEAALALLASSLVSLAVQQPSARFLVLDGTAPHEPHAGYLKSVMEGWPQPMESVERAGLTAALAGLAGEMNERLQGTSIERGVRYLVINGLHRYREFRRADDDLGFGRRGAERTASPLEHLQALLRDGPTVGIHLLIWCDSLVNVMRSLDRQGLRECGQRVLFQMNAADSSHLLDSPLASRLGRNRALFSTDETAQPEKFRPYGLPSLAWLAEVKQKVAQRADCAEKPATQSVPVG